MKMTNTGRRSNNNDWCLGDASLRGIEALMRVHCILTLLMQLLSWESVNLAPLYTLLWQTHVGETPANRTQKTELA